jgi:aminoacylase
VVLSQIGSAPSLPSVVLNSHTDVVPVSEEFWTCPPFEARKLADGRIVARGAQDMKCVGIWYMEALRALKQAGKTFKRTIHLTFVPDEEIGGFDGMKAFIGTPLFKSLNVGFALDEGLASADNDFKVHFK